MFENRKIKGVLAFAAGVISLNVGAAGIAHAAHYKVFLMGGQSNMAGRAPVTGLPPALQGSQSDVLFYSGTSGPLEELHPNGVNAGEFGPDVTFGRAIADAYPSTQFALIKYAVGGTALHNDWAPDTGSGPGPLYANFQLAVTNGLAALHAAGHTTEIVGMAWHQGESDAVEGQQASYQDNLTNFIVDIRSKYGANLPFMIGEIRRGSAATIAVADAQIAVAAADPNAIFVTASDLSFLDTFHFDAPSQITLGERFASAYVTLDGLPLSLASITDDQGGGQIVVGTTVSYTLTFSEDMDASTVDAVDFENAGTATVSWGAISEVTPGVFTLALTPDSSGTLQLQVVQDAELLAADGDPLDTTAPIADETVITVTESGTGGIVAGTVIGVDFSGTPDGNFNGVTSNGTITDLKDTTGATLMGVNLTSSGGAAFNGQADHTKSDQPSQFTEAHLTDWVVISGGVNYTISLAGLNNSMTYNLVIGGANGSNFNVDTTWSVDGQSDTTDAGTSSSTDGSGAYVSFTGLETDGSGNLVITGFKSSNYAVVCALELTAVSANAFATWIADPAFGLDSAEQGFDLDPDGDGIANGLEAWFGTHPGQSNTSLAGLVSEGNRNTFTHPKNTSPPADLAGVYQWSPNLSDWYAGDGVDGPDGGPTVTILADNAATTTVTATASESMGRVFMRVQVTQN